jgi:hypothetical protein
VGRNVFSRNDSDAAPGASPSESLPRTSERLSDLHDGADRDGKEIRAMSNREEKPIVSDEEQFLDELDDLIFRGYLEFCGNERLTITEKGKAALAEARKES